MKGKNGSDVQEFCLLDEPSDGEGDEELVASTVEDIRKWVKKLEPRTGFSKYCEFNDIPIGKGTVTTLLRYSTVRRYQGYQIDIVSISTEPTNCGVGSAFVNLLSRFAAEVGRGVYLEATRTASSQALAKSLVKKQGFEPYRHSSGDKGNWLRQYKADAALDIGSEDDSVQQISAPHKSAVVEVA